MGREKKDERVTVAGDAAYIESVLALLLQQNGHYTFDPAMLEDVKGLRVIILPSPHNGEHMVAVADTEAKAAAMRGRPGKGRLH